MKYLQFKRDEYAFPLKDARRALEEEITKMSVSQRVLYRELLEEKATEIAMCIPCGQPTPWEMESWNAITRANAQLTVILGNIQKLN